MTMAEMRGAVRNIHPSIHPRANIVPPPLTNLRASTTPANTARPTSLLASMAPVVSIHRVSITRPRRVSITRHPVNTTHLRVSIRIAGNDIVVTVDRLRNDIMIRRKRRNPSDNQSCWLKGGLMTFLTSSLFTHVDINTNSKNYDRRETRKW